MIEIVDKAACCGCSACEQICPTNCITMEPDDEGFSYPIVDKERCINCGKCVRVCPFLNIYKKDNKPKAYASTHKNIEILKKSSSGGVFYALSNYVLNNNGVVFGASFDKNFDVKHVIAENIDELYPIMGSKYVQSDINNTYIQARQELESGRMVLFSGTQCQVNGLITFLGKSYENLTTVAIICHGVPSPLIWRKYLKRLSIDKGCNVVDVRFRQKNNGWRYFNFFVKFDNGTKHCSLYEGDIFCKGFSQNLFLRPSCYDCRSKGKNLLSDIEIGDFWGVEDNYPNLYNENGVSLVLAHTLKGNSILDKINSFILREVIDYDYALVHNPNIEVSVRPSNKRKDFFKQVNLGDNIIKAISDNFIKPIGAEKRAAYLHNTLKVWLKKNQSNKRMANFLNKFGYKNIAVYGAGELAEIFINDLKGIDINIVCCIDAFAKVSVEDMGDINIINLYEASLIIEEIDCVVVTALLSENQIIYDLTRLGYPLEKIITLNMIVHSM